eukprot:364068-Chlamydomonas_euryale.AAC.5
MQQQPREAPSAAPTLSEPPRQCRRGPPSRVTTVTADRALNSRVCAACLRVCAARTARRAPVVCGDVAFRERLAAGVVAGWLAGAALRPLGHARVETTKASAAGLWPPEDTAEDPGRRRAQRADDGRSYARVALAGEGAKGGGAHLRSIVWELGGMAASVFWCWLTSAAPTDTAANTSERLEKPAPRLIPTNSRQHE